MGNGRRLQLRARYPAGTRSRSQTYLRRLPGFRPPSQSLTLGHTALPRPPLPRALPARGPGGRHPEPSQYLRDPRRRRAGRAALPGDGVAARGNTKAKPEAITISPPARCSPWASRRRVRWPLPTPEASSIAISSPPTSSWSRAAATASSSRFLISGWPRSRAPRPRPILATSTRKTIPPPAPRQGRWISPLPVRPSAQLRTCLLNKQGRPARCPHRPFQRGQRALRDGDRAAGVRWPQHRRSVGCAVEKDPPLVTSLNSAMPSALDSIVAKLLAKDRDQRYRSAEELLADLETVLPRPPFEKRCRSSQPFPPRRPRRPHSVAAGRGPSRAPA